MSSLCCRSDLVVTEINICTDSIKQIYYSNYPKFISTLIVVEPFRYIADKTIYSFFV